MSVCACIRACACISPARARTRVLTGRKGPPRPYQLDDVGDAEPVGGLDVLASFHETLIALEPRSTGVRRIHSSRTALRLCAGAGDLAKTPSGRKQARHPRASGDEAGLSRERPGCPAGASRTPVRGWRGCSFVTECNSQGRVLLPQVATCQVFKIMPGHWAQTANRSSAPSGPLPCGAVRPLPGEPAVLSPAGTA